MNFLEMYLDPVSIVCWYRGMSQALGKYSTSGSPRSALTPLPRAPQWSPWTLMMKRSDLHSTCTFWAHGFHLKRKYLTLWCSSIQYPGTQGSSESRDSASRSQVIHSYHVCKCLMPPKWLSCYLQTILVRVLMSRLYAIGSRLTRLAER